MTAVISPPMFLQFFDPNNSGAVAQGFKFFTYIAGTSTKQTTWTDSTQAVQNANPLPLDANGVAAAGASGGVWLDPALLYKFVWAPANDTDPPSSPIRSIDNIAGPITISTLTQSLIGSVLYPRTTAEIAAAVTPVNYAYVPLNPYRDGADGAGGANDTTAMSRIRSVLAQVTNVAAWLNGLAIPGWLQTAAEAAAGFMPNPRFLSDSDSVLNVFRFMTPAQITAVQSGVNAVDVSTAIQAANDYLEGRAARCILTITVSAGGAGYTNGFYPCVQMSGGTGTNAKCAITVAGGAITSVVPAGPYVVNSVGAATGLAATHTVNAAGLGNYTVGDSLAPVPDAAPTDPLFFPPGGAGAVLTVATISVAGGKTASGLPQGGQLFFPPGYYYCASAPLRVGSFVEWVGNSQNSVQFAWLSTFTGQQIYLGPDESGIYGFVGYYTMGSVLDSMTVNANANCGTTPNGSTSTTWSIFSDGIQQGCYIRRVNINNATNGAILIKDLKGGAYVKLSDIYVQGAAVMPVTAGNPTGQVFSINYGGTVEIDQVSFNGGGAANVANGIFNQGIALAAGSLILQDCQAEEVLTAVDIPAAFLSYAVTIDRMLVTNTNFGTPRGIWIHSTAAPAVNFRSLTAGSGILAVANDNTGYAPLGVAVIPQYIWSGTANYTSMLEGVIHSGVQTTITYASGGTMVPDVQQGTHQRIIANTAAAFTIGAPTYNGAVMPITLLGRRITLQIVASGSALGVITWNAVYKMSAWTNPANGFNRTIEFEWAGSVWYQINQTGVDIPN